MHRFVKVKADVSIENLQHGLMNAQSALPAHSVFHFFLAHLAGRECALHDWAAFNLYALSR